MSIRTPSRPQPVPAGASRPSSAGSIADVPVHPTSPAHPARELPLRRDGVAKLTGEALYTDDLVVPGAWYGATVRSTEPHARLIAIDRRDDGFDWSTVVLVTADDLPGDNTVPGGSEDQPILVPVGGEIRHHAEPIALLAAPDPATLRAARERITLRTEPMEPLFDPLASVRSFAQHELVKGDVVSGLAAADVILEGEYRTGHQEQAYLEGQAMIAVPRDDGGVTVHGSMQCPYYVHAALRQALGLTDVQAQVVQEETGGGFGGKEEYPSMIALHAALLARSTQRPVRMVYDRHEDISATTKRHPSVIRHRTGVMRDGTLVAQDIEVVLDGGAYATLSPVVLSRAAVHAGGPYACPNVRIRARVMATSTPPNGAFRGFGAPQVHFATETQMNRIADALGIGPLEIRNRNAYRPGDETPTGQVLRESVGAHAVLEAVAEQTGFEAARAETTAARAERERSGSTGSGGASDVSPYATGAHRVASGIGLALGWHGIGFTGGGEHGLQSVAGLELTADGRIRILVGSVEMGQGVHTVLPMLVAEQLGVRVDAVEIARADTADVPNSGPTVASRTTMVVGGMLAQAAQKLRARVEGMEDGTPDAATGRTARPFADVYRTWAAAHGPLRIDEPFTRYPGESFDEATHRGDAYPVYSWEAFTARVDVDLDTGEVLVRDVVVAGEIGRVIHPVLASGQIEGGSVQAVGWATIEEIQLDNGRYRNDRLATYMVPTALDAPRTTVILLEEPFMASPTGAKGLGELPMNPGAAAVVAAIADATGAWITELPASPERILAALAVAPRSEPAREAVAVG